MNHPYSRACRLRAAIVTVLLFVWTASSASAQNYTFDARRVALGGVGGTPNVASKLVERQRRYRSILIPVGLVKVLSDVRVFFPRSATTSTFLAPSSVPTARFTTCSVEAKT